MELFWIPILLRGFTHRYASIIIKRLRLDQLCPHPFPPDPDLPKSVHLIQGEYDGRLGPVISKGLTILLDWKIVHFREDGACRLSIE